jgi:hypothetical protein
VHLALPRQHPVKRGRMLATVGCSGHCVAEAVAKVSVKGSRPILVRSPELVFSRRGRHRAAMPFSKGSLPRLRRALREHKKITARVVGEIVDAGGNVEARTHAQTLRIRG